MTESFSFSQNPEAQNLESGGSEHISQAELNEWRTKIEIANQHNVFSHCHSCGYEWVASSKTTCRCGSSKVEYILCWQFPDD
ncbi:hypothetical protein V2H45_09100 [Tumidithrix elongata RA019]|uniref:Uncharacterized protein n=1 Tax=Tumidithrix elongata BACA0141 TaxID=2716417 RepID=A0AAW9PRX4_9CYAN|nr:hypothetical protein [Tumidithrix elongata RA019]